jgi:sugar lactone lactonase YvrE
LARQNGSTDGTAAAARFFHATGITTDGTSLFVADSANHTIRRVDIATGEVATLAGKAGVQGWADGVGVDARFYNPGGITTDGVHVFVSDSNFTVRKIVIATGEVTTLAGRPGTAGSADGVGGAARFAVASGLTTDGTNLFVADTTNSLIRKMVIATGEVTTLAGTGQQTYANGFGRAAGLSFPSGITTDGSSLFVADSLNNAIRQID